jgi:hypothetical protein
LRRITIVLVLFMLGIGALVACGDEQAAPPSSSSTTLPEITTTTVPPPPLPLTGLPTDDAAALARPALVVKLDNLEPKARPHAGLNEADVVYEERVEGAVTRLLAIFQSTDAPTVGPVRSARTSDIGIFTPLNRPLFVWSGANDFFARRIRDAAIVDVGYDAATSHYYRERSRNAPSNLFITSTADLVGDEGSRAGGPPPALFEYRAPGDSPPNGASPVAGVHITFGTGSGRADVEYRWDGKGWARSQAGTPYVDTAGVQIAPENVIVQFVPYASSGVNDSFGHAIPEAQLVGDGLAWVLTDGKLIEARWWKPRLDAVTTFTDASGAPVGLTPGNTWVALPPPGAASVIH